MPVKKITILTADDDPQLLRLVSRNLQFEGKEASLTPIEYRILAYLAQNAGRVVTQDMLLENVWGAEYIGESYMLQVNVNRMRRKLEPDPTNPRYLLTKVGVGYLLATFPIRITSSQGV